MKTTSSAELLKLVHSLPSNVYSASAAGPAKVPDAADASRIVITGFEIVIDAGKDTNHLFETLNASDKVKNQEGQKLQYSFTHITFACETLRIRSALRLPQCTVVIYARRLIFEGNGCIDTTPAPWEKDQAERASGSTPGRDGAKGFSGGDITAWLSEIIQPSGAQESRLIANGGPGLKGGAGIDGEDGRTVDSLGISAGYKFESEYTDSFVTCRAKIEVKNAPVIGIHYKWEVLFITAIDSVWGKSAFPTDGTDAIAPGKSGDGGDSGLVTTNLRAAAQAARVEAGRGASAPKEARGGSRGLPHPAYFYDMTFDHAISPWSSKDRSGSAKVSSKSVATKDGVSHAGKAGTDGQSRTPIVKEGAAANVWLHPEYLGRILPYVRSCYLAGQYEEVHHHLDVLCSDRALLARMPSGAGSSFGPDDAPMWAAASAELVAMQQRLVAGLDYFGKPPGYMPLFSLPGALRLHTLEIDTALRALIMCGWAQDLSAGQRSLQRFCEETSSVLSKQSLEIMSRIEDQQKYIKDIDAQLRMLRSEQEDVMKQLEGVRTDLHNEAGKDLVKKAAIKGAVNIAAALCNVVPVGQPYLGSVASLGAAGVDYFDSDMDEEKAIEGIKTSFESAVTRYKAAEKEAKSVIKQTKSAAETKAREQRKKVTPEAYEQLNKTEVSVWTTMGNGVAPAFGHMTKAWKEIQIPQSRIDAQIEKLGAKHERWQALSKKIEAFQQKRKKLLTDLMRLTQEISAGYAQITSNTTSVLTLHRQKAAANVMQPATARVVRELYEDARTALLLSMYNVVRAHESTVLASPKNIDWFFDDLTTKMGELIRGSQGSELPDVKGMVEQLKPFVQGNLAKIRAELLASRVLLQQRSEHCDVVLDNDCPELGELNESLSVKLDPLKSDLIRPNQMGAHIASVKLVGLEFAVEQGQRLPKKGDMIISIEIHPEGIVRAEDGLYRVRTDGPVSFRFTHHFLDGTDTDAAPSELAEDLLNFLMSDSSSAPIKGKLAQMPAWSDMTISVRYLGIGDAKPPQIKSMALRFNVGFNVPPAEKVVLDVRSDRREAAFQCSALKGLTLAGDQYLILPKGRVTLKALPSANPGDEFDRWVVKSGRTERIERSPTLEVDLKDHTRVDCLHVRAGASGAKP